MKYLTLGLLAIPFLSSQAIAQDYPSVRVSAIDEPVCFIDNSRAQRFDLTSLCGVTPAPVPAATSAATVPIAVPTPPNSNRAPTGRNSGTSSSAPSGSAIPQSVPPTPAASTTPLLQPGQSLSGNGSSLSGGGSSGGGSLGGGSSGTCNSPSDLAADGSRCGGRAASQRPGGR